MDTKKAIMFLAGLIEKLNLSHSGSTLHDEEWDMLYALKDGDFSVFEARLKEVDGKTKYN